MPGTVHVFSRYYLVESSQETREVGPSIISVKQRKKLRTQQEGYFFTL